MRWAGVLCVLGVLAAGCVGPSRTDSDYARKASHAAESMISALETARLTAEAAGGGRSPAPYTSLTMSRAERDGDGIVSTFAPVQPPSERSDRVRAELLAVFEECKGVLSELRITARRGTLSELPRIASGIGPLTGELRRFVRP